MIFDANVVVKWIVEEEGWEDARAASVRVGAAAAPAHVVVETGRALLRHVRAGSLTAQDARYALDGVARSIELIPTEALIDDAFEIAVAGRATIYDALYLAAAMRRDCTLITADARLVSGLKGSAWDGRATLLGDWLSSAFGDE